MTVGERHDPSRELFGQGLANLVTPLFGGIPATAAIARTAVNVRSGAVLGSRRSATPSSSLRSCSPPPRWSAGSRSPRWPASCSPPPCGWWRRLACWRCYGRPGRRRGAPASPFAVHHRLDLVTAVALGLVVAVVWRCEQTARAHGWRRSRSRPATTTPRNTLCWRSTSSRTGSTARCSSPRRTPSCSSSRRWPTYGSWSCGCRGSPGSTPPARPSSATRSSGWSARDHGAPVRRTSGARTGAAPSGGV